MILTKSLGIDSTSSAARELGQVFEGFAVEAWLKDQQALLSKDAAS